ncbi:T-complex protein 1 subunit alpha-like isoform X1 [Scylla paramamosain]|uniref:T-complex protein 1 subunit alpha-like isoform X1 n=1 Tax=Scylla paramamosain TaxID=85552 RepID=UPI003083B2D3
MSTFVCGGGEGGGELDTGGAWEGERLAGVFWAALVSLALHTLVISVSVFPAASLCTKHRHAAPESHEYVRYICLEFKDRAAAEEAVRQRNNYKLDKQHTFLCNLFTDFEKYDNIHEEFVAPVPEPYKIGDEYFTFITKCQDPKACTVLLRGPSKDILNEVERNLQDALGVARNLAQEPRLVPGGGSVDMAVSNFLQQKAKGVSEVRQWPYSALAQALKDGELRIPHGVG